VTTAAGVLLALTLVSAVIDWVGAHHDNTRVRYVFKPLTLVLLIGTALALDPADPTVRGWFVVALVLSLAGDVFLMLPGDQFVPGLASFLLAHVAYVVGFVVGGLEPAGVAAGVVLVAIGYLVVGRRLIGAVQRSEPALAPPVLAYMGVISAMLVCAVGSLNPVAIAGGVLFYLSDSLIGWGRFVKAHDWGALAVMVTYHLGQVLLVLSLL
jgi:uncharacterized membrane protein YhhN